MINWVADTSAVWKIARSPQFELWADRIARGLVRAALPTWLEVARSARSTTDWQRLKGSLLTPLVPVGFSPRSDALALEISNALVEAGLHRAVPVPDVLIASVALAEGLTVLHDDHDFVRIAQVVPELAHERLQL